MKTHRTLVIGLAIGLSALVGSTTARDSLASEKSREPAATAQVDEGIPDAYKAARTPEAEARKARSRFQYLMLGYGLVWICLGAYLFSLNRRVQRVGDEMRELAGRLDDAEKEGRSG